MNLSRLRSCKTGLRGFRVGFRGFCIGLRGFRAGLRGCRAGLRGVRARFREFGRKSAKPGPWTPKWFEIGLKMLPKEGLAS